MSLSGRKITEYLSKLADVLNVDNRFLWDTDCLHTAVMLNDDLHLFDNGGKICFVENYDRYGLKDYHCFVYFEGKYYDASLAEGSTKISDLEFFKIYMSSFSEEYLKKHTVFVDSKKDLDKYNTKLHREFELAFKNQNN